MVDTTAGKAEVHGLGYVDRPEIVLALGRWVGAHPMLSSYRARPEDMTPLRMSDLMAVAIRRSHPVYSEVDRTLGADYQVIILLTPFRTTRRPAGDSTVRHDFTDDEMAVAARLQPVLMVLNHASVCGVGRADAASGTTAAARAERIDRLGLTPHDMQILDSWRRPTATAIGACRISPRTVRKHLQNIYAKLECHDRLMAVRQTSELCLSLIKHAGLLHVDDLSRGFRWNV